jgi:hypothetical protein
LLAAEVVTADGKVITASADQYPELFWGLRGGGGNFGIVTAFSYRLHPIGPQVLAGPVLWPLEDGPEVLGFYQDFVAQAPNEVATIVTLRRAPPLPVLPVELHRRPVCMITMCYLGDPAVGQRALAPLRDFGRPLLDLVDLRPYTGLQALADATVPHGWHYYWKSADLPALDDDVIDALTEHASRIRSSQELRGAVPPGWRGRRRRSGHHGLLPPPRRPHPQHQRGVAPQPVRPG